MNRLKAQLRTVGYYAVYAVLMMVVIAEQVIIAVKSIRHKGCFQYDCCRERGYSGCWECPDFSCDKDMFDEKHLRLKTFVKCIKEDGIETFSQYILRNLDNGIVYHRSGGKGDYDLDTEEAILRLLRTGEK